MKLVSLFRKHIETVMRVVLLCLLVGYLILAMLMPPLGGETSSFILPLVSMTESGNFAITEEELQDAVQLFPSFQADLEGQYERHLPRDEQGNIYPYYFGAYIFLCIPIFMTLQLFHLNVLYSFSITNALLLVGALYLVYSRSHLKNHLRLLLILFLGLSPIVPYIPWISYETATCAFVIASMVYWFTNRRNLSALLLSVAGTMNPTVMAFGILMILEYFFQRLQADGWHVFCFVRRCVSDWKEIGIYALCFVPSLIPMGITYAHFSSLNAVAMLGVTDYAGVPSRFLAYLFDLNLGLLPYVPLLLPLGVGVFVCAARKKNWKFLFAILGVLGTIAAFSLISHINCGMDGIARYNAWLLPMLVFTAVYAIDRGVFWLPFQQRGATALIAVSIVWCVFTVVVAHGVDSVHWTPYAEIVLEYAPQLYNPLPSTFNCRTNHIDGGYAITEPVVYSGEDGYVRKVLVPTSLGKGALSKLVVGEADQAVFDSECQKIENGGEFCYLNFPSGTKIQYAENYTLGDEILFTNENDGRKYFLSGMSYLETNFAWSDGPESKLQLNVGTVQEDIQAEFDFLSVYQGAQTLAVTSHGQELFYDVVTQENPHVSFTIPVELVENGVITLEFAYPDAVNLTQVSNGADQRTIAFAWNRVVFGVSAGSGAENIYTLGDEILFTTENDGTKYFLSGISYLETNFAWSDGPESKLQLNVGTVQEDIQAEFDFLSVYQGTQTLIVTSQGQELFHGVVTQENLHVSFTIPQELINNGVISLSMQYPEAASPLSRGESQDSRVLALTFHKIVFDAVGQN